MIRKSVYGSNVIDENTPDIVSCDELRPFWIRWGQGVEVGEGTVVGARVFMKLTDTNPKPVVAVALSTGWESSGEWRISSVEGEYSGIILIINERRVRI